ncbi:MAG: ATP-binding protein, partial [Proteobacteria bacterium]|nr:ATP-binding protein [Pseudomonadota bacterium]
ISDWKRHYSQVAVRPDWTDPTGLLGFVNSISDPPSYRPADTLNFLLEADRDRTRPYFLCLDEMNLARVEHYFAPFLSAMESPAVGLRIHGEPDTIDNVDPILDWPNNLFIFGTVNMDESTHPFSDKVLDRAFTFEFWDVDLDQWDKKWRSTVATSILDPVTAALKKLYAALFPARRHFGYRTADEVLHFCLANGEHGSFEALLDAAILMKVLPRVRGDDSGPLGAALAETAKVSAAFPRTLNKVRQMQEGLANSGHARFWS